MKFGLSLGVWIGYNTGMEFHGFSQQTFAFFMGIAFNNTARTMQENRKTFEEHVLEPLRALSRECEQVLFPVDSRIDFRPVMGGTISRIRRDTRFSRNKEPYRDYMWLDFRRKNEDFHLGFCFSISPRSSSVMMGMHESETAARNRMRTYVVQYAAQFVSLHEKLVAKGYALVGEDYVKPMTKDVSSAVYDFGQKRWFSYRKQIPLAETMRPEFTGQLREYMKDLSPMYLFLRRAFE